jgi:hypothetical protein
MRWCGLEYSGTRFSEHSNELCWRHERRKIFTYTYLVSQEEVNLVCYTLWLIRRKVKF